MAKKEQRLHCSFCGRSDSEVELLMPGAEGCICSDCAEHANEIAKEYLNKKSAKCECIGLKVLREKQRKTYHTNGKGKTLDKMLPKGKFLVPVVIAECAHKLSKDEIIFLFKQICERYAYR